MSHEHEQHHAVPRRATRPARSAVKPEEHESTAAEQATFMHQVRQLTQSYSARAAAKAGAAPDSAHAAPSILGGHTALAGTGATSATPAGGQPDDFAQVQDDLAHGKFADALGVLDRYWPASARDEAEARAYVGGVIVAKLHAALAPLTMDGMLHTLEPLEPPRGHRYLDEVITGGQRLRDLLLYAATGLDRDRISYALEIVERGIGFTQTGPQPHYLVSHYDDYTDAVTYFKGQRMPVDSAQHLPLASEQVYLHTVLPQALDTFSRRAKDGVDEAIDSVGDDSVDYTAWFTTMAGTVLRAAACLTGGGAVAVIGFAAAGAAVAALGSVPTAKPTLKDLVKRNIGDKDSKGQNNNCSVINNLNGKFVSEQYANAQKYKWDDNRLSLEILKQAFVPALITITGDGVPSLDGDAVHNVVKRDVLLRAVGMVGRVVYNYDAVGMIQHDEGAGGDSDVYNPPATWAYTLTGVTYTVQPRSQQAFQSALLANGMIVPSLKAPKLITINKASEKALSNMTVVLDADNGVEYAGASSLKVGEGDQTIVVPAATFGGDIRDGAWGGAGHGPPSAPLTGVDSEPRYLDAVP